MSQHVSLLSLLGLLPPLLQLLSDKALTLLPIAQNWFIADVLQLLAQPALTVTSVLLDSLNNIAAFAVFGGVREMVDYILLLLGLIGLLDCRIGPIKYIDFPVVVDPLDHRYLYELLQHAFESLDRV